jgi:hypothetical protein
LKVIEKNLIVSEGESTIMVVNPYLESMPQSPSTMMPNKSSGRLIGLFNLQPEIHDNIHHRLSTVGPNSIPFLSFPPAIHANCPSSFHKRSVGNK